MYSKVSTVRGIAGAFTLLACMISACMAECPAKQDTVRTTTVDDISGSWHMVAGVSTNDKNDKKCVTYEVSEAPGGYNILFTAKNVHTDELEITNGTVSFNEDNTGTWQRIAPTRLIHVVHPEPMKHRIIAVNKYEYLVMVICDIKIENHRPEAAMILSREKTLPSARLLELKDKLSQYFDRNVIFDAIPCDCDGGPLSRIGLALNLKVFLGGHEKSFDATIN